MTQESINVTYSLEQILTDINKKLEKLDEKLDGIRQDVNDIKVDLVQPKSYLKNLKEDFQELKGRANAQIWTLIVILITAFGGF